VLERLSGLDRFFTGGLEIDDRLDGPTVWRFAEDVRALLEVLDVPQAWGHGVLLKLSRLGRHQADGLYFPAPAILAVDPRTLHSFAHELGHLIDYRAHTGAGGGDASPVLSTQKAFGRFHTAMWQRMMTAPRVLTRLRRAGGRISWAYYSSPSECFARAFEQLASERLASPATVVKDAEALRRDHLYFPSLPDGLEAYFREMIRTAAPAPDFALESGTPNLQNAPFPTATHNLKQNRKRTKGGFPCLKSESSAAARFSVTQPPGWPLWAPHRRSSDR